MTTSGTGTVTSSPSGIDCGADCTETYAAGTTVTLAATPGTGATFTGWGGGCSGTGPCTLTLTANTSVTATFGIEQVPLTVQRAGAGSGTVQSTPAGIDCGNTCSASFAPGTAVTLTASADAGSRFTGWSGGGCSGTGPCTTTLSAATTVVATFIPTFPVTVTLAGNGGGSVVSAPAGIDCGLDCSETFDSGTAVALTATPAAGSSFAGWSGGCSGTGACILSVAATTSVTATFTRDTFLFTVTLAGNGSGAVTSSPAGIDCGLDCSETWDWGTVVTLTATPATGSLFTGWGGGCSGTGPCTVTLSALTTVVATFTLTTHDLLITPAGTGAGTVSSAPAGIDCGTDCTEAYDYGTSVTLTATPSPGSTFDGWSGGGCSGTGTCVTTLTAAATITPTFTLTRHVLTVARSGNGSGSVTSAPVGISCGVTCAGTYDYGTSVTLTAAPSADSTFTGWSGGGCTGTGTCTVSITAAATVTANFALKQYTVDVRRQGAGSGTVTSSPTGISCGASCSGQFDHGTVLTFTATPDASSAFSGWSGGGCTGTGTCVVTLTAPLTLDATFTQLPVTLTVVPAGGGTGVVTSAPAGITCGTDCTEPYSLGTTVVLTAAAAPGSSFAGWSGGGCTGTGTCSVTMNAATSVTATFSLTGACDTFSVANSTVITGWTERVGDWLIESGRLRDNTGGSAYSHVITMDGSTQLNGCAHLTAIHTGSLSLNAVGVVLRWASPSSYVVAVVQDNSSAGNFNTAYIYQYPLADIGGGPTNGTFGRNADIELCVTGTNVTFRIDANRDGTFETTKTAVTTVTAPGLAGVAMYATPPNALADNFCWYP